MTMQTKCRTLWAYLRLLLLRLRLRPSYSIIIALVVSSLVFMLLFKFFFSASMPPASVQLSPQQVVRMKNNFMLMSPDHRLTPFAPLLEVNNSTTPQELAQGAVSGAQQAVEGARAPSVGQHSRDIYDLRLADRYRAQVVVVGSHWAKGRWSNAEGICKGLRDAGEHCALQRALYARDVTPAQLSQWIHSDQLSCVRASFSAWDVPFVGAEHWKPVPSPLFENLEHLMAHHPGKIGCALSHVSALRHWINRLDRADRAAAATGTASTSRSAAHYDETYDSVEILNSVRPAESSSSAVRSPSSSAASSSSSSRVLLVLEDDVAIHREFSLTLRERLAELEAAVGDDWDLLDVLDRTMFWRPLTPRPLGQPRVSQNLTELRWDFSRVTSLVYSERGARRLLAQLPVDTAMDFFVAHLLRNGHVRGFHSDVPLARIQTSAMRMRFRSQIGTLDTSEHRLADPLLGHQVGLLCAPYVRTAIRAARLQRDALLAYGIASILACVLVLALFLACFRLVHRTRRLLRHWLTLRPARPQREDHKLV